MTSEDKGIEVTVRDLETGDEEAQVLRGDQYLVICTGQMFVAYEQVCPTPGGANVTIRRDNA